MRDYNITGDEHKHKHTHTNKHTHLLFEQLALLGRQRVGLGDERDDVDLVMESLHELNVQWLQTGGKTDRMNDTESARDIP